MDTVFFTGFPGFLGSALLPRVLARATNRRAVCLVQARYADEARARAAVLEAMHPDLRGRIELVSGDITLPGLGLGPRNLPAATVQIFHLAAVYDLAVPRDLAERVNVGGTRHVLDWAARCPSLDRLHYVSTCYVSGRWPGVFRETDLSGGQTFHNWYEDTKHRAELEVRQRMSEGLAATIYRPAIVVGDSVTGETQKYDGPYRAMCLLLRQGRVAVMPVVGCPSETILNLVPRDFVVDAIAHLSSLARSHGMTYHLADPEATSVSDVLHAIGEATGQRVLQLQLPYRLARASLRRLTWLRTRLGLTPESLDYFRLPTRYDTSTAQRDLAGSGIHVPRFASYVPTLLAFMRANRSLGSAGMS